MKNLVMGVAKGYGWQELEPFVTSCKKFCPEAELILFVDDTGDFTLNKLIRAGAITEDNKIFGNKILRGDGGVPAVVHQYNRHSELVELVDNIYRDKNFSFDARFTDTRSTVEQVACLLNADKTVEAAQIFLRKFLSPADFGKSLNTLIKILDIATQKNFAPPVELIELAVQNILMNAENFSIAQVFAIYKALMRSKDMQHAVDPQFKENIAARLLKFAKDYFAKGDTENYNLLIEMAEDLNVSSKFD